MGICALALVHTGVCTGHTGLTLRGLSCALQPSSSLMVPKHRDGKGLKTGLVFLGHPPSDALPPASSSLPS